VTGFQVVLKTANGHAYSGVAGLQEPGLRGGKAVSRGEGIRHLINYLIDTPVPGAHLSLDFSRGSYAMPSSD